MTTPLETRTTLPWAGQAYSIKRHGVTLTSCDSEPVQTPGCIQAHGALLVVRLADRTILQVSENAHTFFGHTAEALLGQPVSVAIGDDADSELHAFLAGDPPARNPVRILTLPEMADRPALDLTVHTTDGVALLEVEPAEGDREDASQLDPHAPLRRAIAATQGAAGVREFCQAVTAEVRTLTGFDRVMVYRFHEDGHGEVFAEARAPELSPWLGMHYPAEDIPAPAREIFRQIWIRPVPDVGGELAELVPLANPDTGAPLTMTYCALRGASVMYTEYLLNMGVKGALTLSIRRDGALWGLIACHHYAGPRHLSYRLRATCELFAQIASLQWQAVHDREQFAYRARLAAVHDQLITGAIVGVGLSFLTEGTPNVLHAIDASGAAVYDAGRWWRAGKTPGVEALDALGTWLVERDGFADAARPVYATDALARDYPPAEAFADVASGLLAVRIGRAARSFLLWFRPETIQTVSWRGDPSYEPMVLGPNGPRLTPRRSFDLFVESVRSRSLPWQEPEIEAALHLRMLVLELVVARGESLGELNDELLRSNDDLDAFVYVASHDLKEPLRGIHKYAHQLLEAAGLASDAQRAKLERIASLTVRMDSLLSSLLAYSRVGRADVKPEAVDLGELLEEALEMVHARRAERPTELLVPRSLPVVQCDRVLTREIFVNLISNALKYNDADVRRIEIGHLTPPERREQTVGVAPDEAREQMVFFVRDNGIGVHARHHEQVFKMFKRLHGQAAYGGGTGAGLAIVRKLVERQRGLVWLDSEPGKGTTVNFTLGGEPA